jgi:hypothetical protein
MCQNFVRMNPQKNLILSQTNPFHTLSFYFFETRIDSSTATILVQETLAKTKRLFPFDTTRTA